MLAACSLVILIPRLADSSMALSIWATISLGAMVGVNVVGVPSVGVTDDALGSGEPPVEDSSLPLAIAPLAINITNKINLLLFTLGPFPYLNIVLILFENLQIATGCLEILGY